MFELLETRRHLSVTAADIHDTLYVWGDNNPNGINVYWSGGYLKVQEYKGSGIGYQQIFQVLNSAVNAVRIYGYDSADTITISDNVDKPATIMGGRGADYLKGGGGQSVVLGHGDWASDPSGSHRPNTDDNAADTLVTGSGVGSNTLRGHGGNDALYFNSRFKYGQPDIGWGDAGNDTLYIDGQNAVIADGRAGNDVFKPGASRPQARLKGGGGSDSVDFADYGVGVFARADGTQSSGPFDTIQYGQRKLAIEADIENLLGTNVKDTLIATNSGGNLWGRGGNDYLYGNGGKDLLQGGEGNDRIWGRGNNDTAFGENGDDMIYGEGGNDILLGADGNDTIEGGNGNDMLRGGNNNDLLKGGNNNDSLYGEDGSDWLYGDGGTNFLVGGAGSDYLNVKNGSAFDVVLGNNVDGTGGSGGAFDIVVADMIAINGVAHTDLMSGVESVSYN